MMRTYVFLLMTTLLAGSCGNKETSVEAVTEHHDEAPATEVALTARQIEAAGIELGKIEMKNLQTSIKASGTLTVPNDHRALVTSITSGVIRSLNIHPGRTVRKGQTVATIVNPELAGIQQSLQTTNAEITMAETELKRQEELVEGNAAPLKNLQRVRTQLATLYATRNSLRQQLQAMGISADAVARGSITTSFSVKAPISGIVSEVSAQIGSNVDPSTPIAQIINSAEFHLDLFVYEQDLSKLYKDQVIKFVLTNNPEKEYSARIISIGNTMEMETRSVPVHAIVQGDKTGLIDGMNTTAIISMGEKVMPAVPEEAIVSHEGKEYIIVVHHDETDTAAADSASNGATHFAMVQVIRGVTDAGFTEIKTIEQIAPDTEIVVRGAFYVLAAITGGGGEHDH